MQLLKKPLILAVPLIAILIIVIFSLTMLPSINPAPKNMPIAIVNEDQGVDVPNQGNMNMGKLIIDNVAKSTADAAAGDSEPAVKWVAVSSEAEVLEGLNDQQYYAALVIPADFSQKQASLRTAEPSQPNLTIYVNQGMNTATANAASQILSQMTDGINANIRTELLAAFDQQGGTVTTKQAAALASPIIKNVQNVNEIGTHTANGNAPVSMFQPLWMASLLSAVIFFLVKNKLSFLSWREKLWTNVLQVLAGAVLALIVGYAFTWTVDLLGMNVAHFTDTVLFLSISFLAFFLMISAVLSWTGLAGMPVFILLLFFGAPLLAMAPEMLSPFYQDYIFSWLPMRYMVMGLREIFFFGQGISWSHPTVVLTAIGAGSLLVLLASSLKLGGGKRVAQSQYSTN